MTRGLLRLLVGVRVDEDADDEEVALRGGVDEVELHVVRVRGDGVLGGGVEVELDEGVGGGVECDVGVGGVELDEDTVARVEDSVLVGGVEGGGGRGGGGRRRRSGGRPSGWRG